MNTTLAQKLCNCSENDSQVITFEDPTTYAICFELFTVTHAGFPVWNQEFSFFADWDLCGNV